MATAERDGAVIRPARTDEVPSVLVLWAEHGSDLSRIPDDREELERLVEGSPSALLVAERGGEIVGALIAAFDGHRGHMHRLAVAEPERGAGLGRRLIEAGHELLRELGARRVDAIVGVEEESASVLWRNAGYEADPPELVRWARNL